VHDGNHHLNRLGAMNMDPSQACSSHVHTVHLLEHTAFHLAATIDVGRNLHHAPALNNSHMSCTTDSGKKLSNPQGRQGRMGVFNNEISHWHIQVVQKWPQHAALSVSTHSLTAAQVVG
jgi:hypothetical protein